MPLFETVTDLNEGADRLRCRRYGMIEAAGGQFRRVVLRPLPKIVSGPGVHLFGEWQHRHRRGDAIRIFYDQPWRFSQFLAVKYAESTAGTSPGHANSGLGHPGRGCLA